MGFTNFNDKYSAIPQELKGYKNWVCWQAYPDPKSHSGISKKPINPRTGGLQCRITRTLGRILKPL